MLAKDAFLALYDQDVRVFDVWSEWSCRGLDAVRGMVAGWLGSLDGKDSSSAVKIVVRGGE